MVTKQKWYYQAAFATSPDSKSTKADKPNLYYKPVTDCYSVRQWNPTDPNFESLLAQKGLKKPCFKGAKKILGAEILVIKATRTDFKTKEMISD